MSITANTIPIIINVFLRSDTLYFSPAGSIYHYQELKYLFNYKLYRNRFVNNIKYDKRILKYHRLLNQLCQGYFNSHY